MYHKRSRQYYRSNPPLKAAATPYHGAAGDRRNGKTYKA
jgi:hypothetical protein